MKRALSIIAIMLIGLSAFSQQKQGHVMRPSSKGMGHPTEIGRAQVEAMYALNAEDISDERTYIDLHVLLAGKGISKHYSRFLELNDSLADDFNKRNQNASGRPRAFYSGGRNRDYWSEYQFTDIYTENGQHTFYAWMPRYMERYNAYYTEPVQNQQWTLHEERQTILGHECQRATCHWRGRDFEAWFAADIPVRLGPWTFSGLPGLILRLYDMQRLYTWEAVSLRSGDFPITKRKYEGFRHDSREHVYKLQVAANRDYLKAGGAIDRATGQPKSKQFPYDPLELE
ncbi:MAG: GLPGLI family protein [Bacteroidales bacterium]|nr:GLPGLI family protein [Bacteroidales bacterium]